METEENTDHHYNVWKFHNKVEVFLVQAANTSDAVNLVKNKKYERSEVFAESNSFKVVEVLDTSVTGFSLTPRKNITLEEAVTNLEKEMIVDSLQRNNYNITKAAKELKLTRRGLYTKIERYGLEYQPFQQNSQISSELIEDLSKFE